MPTVLDDLLAMDQAVYMAVAGTQTPALDRYLRPLTSAADHSKLWLAAAGAMAAFGGPEGRRTALQGLASVLMASAAVNQGAKHISRRPRPDRDAAAVPVARHVVMPASTSFPSGHAASAFAFAEGVSQSRPLLGLGLRALATTVAYTRVHSGVHFPADVLAGALIGVACGKSAPRLVVRTRQGGGE